MSYRYLPLNRREKEIRLLEILPAKQSDSSNRVHCLLHHCALTSGVIYIALSYTWAYEDDELDMSDTLIDLPQNKDTQSSIGRIVVDGIELCVMANLESALQQVRQSLSSGSTMGSARVAPGDQFPLGSVQPAGGVLIWADAVCINQRDATEKGHQVDLMYEIYGTAAQVVVWLGPASNDSDLGMLILATWGLVVDSGIFQLAGDLDQLVTSWLDPKFQYHGKHASTVKALRTLAGRTDDSHPSVPTSVVESLLQRRWWTRVWIIQEYVAAQNLNFWCGESIVPDAYIARAVAALEMLGAIVVGLVERYGDAAAECLTMMEKRIPRPYEIRLARKLVVARSVDGMSKLPLLDRLTRMGSDSSATDRRDAVFALLGISEDTKELGLKADYTLEVSDVYTNTAMALAKAGNMEILSLAQSSQSLVKDAPSWVPDWMTIRPTSTFSIVPNRTGNGAMDQLYSASGTTKVSLRVDGRCLAVTGVLVDEIQHQCPNLVSLYDPSRKEGDLYRAMHALTQSLQDHITRCATTASKETISTKIIRTLCAEQGNEKFKWTRWQPNDEDEEVFNAIYQGSEDGVSSLSRIESSKYVRAVNYILDPSRTCFGTTKGLIGIGPSTYQVGDIVVILYGSNVPFVLRPEIHNFYKLIGEAYIDGIMHGEYLEQDQISRTFRIV